MSNTPLNIRSLAASGKDPRKVPDRACRRLLRRNRLARSPKPTSHHPTRGGAPPNGHPRGPEPDVLTVVGTTILTVTGEPLGVTASLENLQLAPVGTWVQVKFTCWLNPFEGVKRRA